MQPVLEGMPAGGPVDAGELASASAAHSLLIGARRATRVDLLLSTVLEILVVGGLTTSDVEQQVAEAWPRACITSADIVEVLELASDRGQQLVIRGDGLQGPVWQLSDAGRAEVDTTQEWLDGFKRRATQSIQDRAKSDFRPCTWVEATQWIERLIGAIGVGIRAATQAYVGDVDLLSDATVRPMAADEDMMQRLVTEGIAEDVGDFLRASAIAALDPTDPFGNEVVTVLSTSCVLHGFLARLDEAAQQRTLGPLAGQEAVLDTPLLIALASGTEVRRPLEQMIDSAIHAGISIIILEHYLDELNDLVAAVQRSDQPKQLERILRDRERRAAYIALSDRDDLLAAYAQLRHEQIVDDWLGFEQHIRNLERSLVQRGAIVRPHGNSDSRQVEDCRSALAQVINDAGGERRIAAIDRDANTMSMALRHRRHFRRDHSAIAWPGLFVVTRDRRLTPAFRDLEPSLGKMPLAITPTTFTLMVARVRPVPEVATLATAASQLLVREVANRVAVRFPPSIAAELAQRLGGAGGATDVRVAQFPTVASVLEGSVVSSDEVFAEVERRRIRRARLSAGYANRIQELERAAASERVAVTERTADSIRDERDRAVAEVERRNQELENLRAQLASQLSPKDIASLKRRAAVRAVVVAANLLLAIWVAITASWLWSITAFVGGVILWLQTEQWVRDPSVRLRESIVAIAGDTAGLLMALFGWLQHH